MILWVSGLYWLNDTFLWGQLSECPSGRDSCPDPGFLFLRYCVLAMSILHAANLEFLTAPTWAAVVSAYMIWVANWLRDFGHTSIAHWPLVLIGSIRFAATNRTFLLLMAHFAPLVSRFVVWLWPSS